MNNLLNKCTPNITSTLDYLSSGYGCELPGMYNPKIKSAYLFISLVQCNRPDYYGQAIELLYQVEFETGVVQDTVIIPMSKEIILQDKGASFRQYKSLEGKHGIYSVINRLWLRVIVVQCVHSTVEQCGR